MFRATICFVHLMKLAMNHQFFSNFTLFRPLDVGRGPGTTNVSSSCSAFSIGDMDGNSDFWKIEAEAYEGEAADGMGERRDRGGGGD